MNAEPRTNWIGCCLGVLLAVSAVPVLAGGGAQGGCVSAQIAEPVLLPTGDVHPSGRLTLCVTRHFTPISTLHKTYVNGRLIGLLQSRRGESEGASDRPFMMFNRDGDGRLHLYGYATPAGSRMATYQLGARREVPRESSMARGAAATAGNLVLMASTTSGPR